MLALLLVLPALAGTTWNPMNRTRSLVVEVVDDLGRPVSTATIRVDDENLRHRVNHRTGKWRSDAVYPASVPDDFEPRDRVLLTAAAPGYRPATVPYRMGSRRNTFTVTLEPLAPRSSELDIQLASLTSPQLCSPGGAVSTASTFSMDRSTMGQILDLEHANPYLTAKFSEHLLSLGPAHVDAALSWADIASQEVSSADDADIVGLVDGLFRVRALAHHMKWQQAEIALIGDPTRSGKRASEKARLDAVEVASTWLQWADSAGEDTDLAQSLCMAVARRTQDCAI